MMICRVCAVENRIVRILGNFEMGFCPICEEYHALYTVLQPQHGGGYERAQALVEKTRRESMLVRGGE